FKQAQALALTVGIRIQDVSVHLRCAGHPATSAVCAIGDIIDSVTSMSISYLYNLQFDENTNTRFAYFFANKTATNASELLLGSGRAANQTSSVSQMSIEQVASGPVAVVANNCLDTALSRSCDCRLVADLTRSRTSDMADEASPGP